MQGKLSWGTLHYSRVDLGSTFQGWIWRPLSKGGHYRREATIEGWPLSKGGTYPRVTTIQGWPLCKGGSWVHYPRVATIQVWNWGPLSKGGPYSRAGHYPRVATIQGQATWNFQAARNPNLYRKFIYRSISISLCISNEFHTFDLLLSSVCMYLTALWY